jgi:hypothetical protein
MKKAILVTCLTLFAGIAQADTYSFNCWNFPGRSILSGSVTSGGSGDVLNYLTILGENVPAGSVSVVVGYDAIFISGAANLRVAKGAGTYNFRGNSGQVACSVN